MTTTGSLRDTLAAVTAALPAGEDRPGQRAMADAVAEAITRGRHLIVQAGTGTGKSLAYLVPAVLSGATVVVATATKALQDQLAGRDLPFLAQHLGRDVSFAVLKGRSNYLCVQKAAELGEEDQGRLDIDEIGDDRTRREIARILEWAKRSPTGDRAELPFEPSPRAWSTLSVGATECPGAARCPMGESCFAEAARRRASDSQVIVVNTHLYGVHLASGGFVLPEHELVVFDEAHELEDITADTLGLELSAGRFRALVRALRGILVDATDGPPLDEAGVRLEEAIVGFRGKRLDAVHLEAIASVLASGVDRVNKALTTLRSLEPPPGKAAARKQRAMKLATHLGEDLAAASSLNENSVAWVEGPEHAPVLKVATVDVGPLLAGRLWADHTAVLTSATVPPNLAARLGISADRVDVLDVGSPFAYRENALLYVPRHLPDPRNPRYQESMEAELEALIRAAGGRTLALFTSWRVMNAAVDALRDRLPYRVLTQIELPKPALIKAFTDDETSCLFATMGFWQGVDVPGPSLSLVVIDRIPFPRPDDPLTQARRERAGDAAFAVVDLPRAATLLAQGAGRLIRSASDRGVVAVLDPRLATKGYRRALLERVPPMKRTVTFSEVRDFLAHHLDAPADASAAQ